MNKKSQDVKPFQFCPADDAFRELARDIAKIPPDKIDFFLACKKIKTQIDVRIEAFWARYNLSPARFQVLLILRAAEGHAMGPSAIAEKIGVTRASMTQFLDALEKTGYLERQDVPGDRRATLIKISTKGLDILNKKILPEYMRRCSSASAQFTKAEMQLFVKMYSKMLQNMERLNAEEGIDEEEEES